MLCYVCYIADISWLQEKKDKEWRRIVKALALIEAMQLAQRVRSHCKNQEMG